MIISEAAHKAVAGCALHLEYLCTARAMFSSVHKQQLWVTYIFFACLLTPARKKTSLLPYEESIWHTPPPSMSLNTEVDAEQIRGLGEQRYSITGAGPLIQHPVGCL